MIRSPSGLMASSGIRWKSSQLRVPVSPLSRLVNRLSRRVIWQWEKPVLFLTSSSPSSHSNLEAQDTVTKILWQQGRLKGWWWQEAGPGVKRKSSFLLSKPNALCSILVNIIFSPPSSNAWIFSWIISRQFFLSTKSNFEIYLCTYLFLRKPDYYYSTAYTKGKQLEVFKW